VLPACNNQSAGRVCPAVGADGCPRDSICTFIQAGFGWVAAVPDGQPCSEVGKVCSYQVQANSTPVSMTFVCGASKVWGKADGGSGGTTADGGDARDSGVNCACGRGAFVPTCGVDGKTYDAACGVSCVPVQIACMGQCPCATTSYACGSDTCMTGQTFCYSYAPGVLTPTPSRSCMQVPAACAKSPTCACLCPPATPPAAGCTFSGGFSTSYCSCSESNGQATVSCAGA